MQHLYLIFYIMIIYYWYFIGEYNSYNERTAKHLIKYSILGKGKEPSRIGRKDDSL